VSLKRALRREKNYGADLRFPFRFGRRARAFFFTLPFPSLATASPGAAVSPGAALVFGSRPQQRDLTDWSFWKKSPGAKWALVKNSNWERRLRARGSLRWRASAPPRSGPAGGRRTCGSRYQSLICFRAPSPSPSSAGAPGGPRARAARDRNQSSPSSSHAAGKTILDGGDDDAGRAWRRCWAGLPPGAPAQEWMARGEMNGMPQVQQSDPIK